MKEEADPERDAPGTDWSETLTATAFGSLPLHSQLHFLWELFRSEINNLSFAAP